MIGLSMMKRTTLLLKIIPLVLFILMALSYKFIPSIIRVKIIHFYVNDFREILFSAFLTLSGFIFTLETFIIVTIKENVYDNKKYIANFSKMQKLNPQLKRYGPLINLKDFLYYTIIYSFIAAIIQLVLGAFNNWYAIATCIWSSIVALLTFAYALYISNDNLKKWFKYIEDD